MFQKTPNLYVRSVSVSVCIVSLYVLISVFINLKGFCVVKFFVEFQNFYKGRERIQSKLNQTGFRYAFSILVRFDTRLLTMLLRKKKKLKRKIKVK